MSEMVEWVAREISNPEIWDEALLKFYGDLWMYDAQVQARATARAAIEAMLEPTEAMISVANTLEASYKAKLKSFEVTGFCWLIYRAMVIEALK